MKNVRILGLVALLVASAIPAFAQTGTKMKTMKPAPKMAGKTAPMKKGMPMKKAAPAKKAAPVKKAAPMKKVAPMKKGS